MENIAEAGCSLAAQPPTDKRKCIAACAGGGTDLLNTPVAAVRPATPSRSRSGPPARDRVRLRRGRPGSAAPSTAGGGTAAGRHGPHRRNCLQCPASGKNYLRAAQDRGVLAILPNGRRVCECHPREKQLAPVDTSLCADVSRYEDLGRSGKDGEQAQDYDTIFYYLLDTLLTSRPIIPDESYDDTFTGH